MADIAGKRLMLKQRMIQKDIIDKNYDKQKFIKYCEEKKHKGSDLNNWTLIQLNDLVVSFIKKEKSSTTSNNPSSSILNKEEKKTNNSKIEDEAIEKIKDSNQRKSTGTENTKQEKIPIINKEGLDQYEVIQCKKQEHTILNNKSVFVSITTSKVTDTTGIFDFSQITYEITTQELNWTVKRIYSDFKWLRAMLSKVAPKTVVPLLPQKLSRLKRIDTDVMRKQTKSLQKFINECLLKEAFKASDALLSFLSMSERTQFDTKMKELTSEQGVFKIDELKTFTGTIVVSNTDQDDNYYTNIAHFLESKSKLLVKLNTDVKKYTRTIDTASQLLEEVSKDFESLFQLTDQVEMKEEIGKGYHELSIFIDNLRVIMINQSHLIGIHMKDFFKKIRTEEMSLSELFQMREEMNSKYVFELNKATAKKDKAPQGKEGSRKDITEDSKTLILRSSQLSSFLNPKSFKGNELIEGLHIQICYLNMSLMKEINDYVINHDKRFEENIRMFSASFYPSLTDGLRIWTELTTYLNKE